MSRKYQLQQQIIEALKANDDDLYSLLKSQWAHRFGVESLEELTSLDLNPSSQNPINVDIGFIVFNEKTYPNLIKFFEENKIRVEKSDMSFSVSIQGSNIE